MIFALLKNGFTQNGHDGQAFLDTDHPVEIDGVTTRGCQHRRRGGRAVVPAGQVPRSPPADPGREREGYAFQQVNKSDDEYVFKNDQSLYGLRARVNAGFGLWQLAWGSKQTLNAASHAIARAALMGRPRRTAGAGLGRGPHDAGGAARAGSGSTGAGQRRVRHRQAMSNPWTGTAPALIVSPCRA